MRKKTLLQTILPLCVVALSALCISLSTVFATAMASEPTWSINSTAYSKILARQSVLAIPEGNKATLNGADYSLTTTVTYPSGKTTTGSQIVLSELGDYVITYSFTDGTNTYEMEDEFSVANASESLFSTSEGITVTPNAELPDWIQNVTPSPLDASVGYVGSTKGIKFTAADENAVLRYDGVIDASKINVHEDLIEMMFTPAVYDATNKQGVKELQDSVIVKFYDAVNPDIHLEFRLSSYHRRNVPVSVRANENESGVWLGNRFINKTDGSGSCYTLCSAYGAFNTDANTGGEWPGVVQTDILPSGGHRPATSSLHLRYDAGTNAAYSFPNEAIYISEAGGYPQDQFDKPVRDNPSPWHKYVPNGYFYSDGNWDFDDYEDFKRGDNFDGFPSGMIKMEMTFPGQGRNELNFMLFNIGGQMLDTWDEENYETKIYVDTNGLDENALPDVVAGKNSFYPVYDAYAYNYIEGVLPTPSAKVYFDSKTEANRLPIINGSFPVTKTGKYYIEYTANPDPSIGDPVKKTIVVVAKEYLDFDVSYRISNLIPTSAFVGEDITLFDGLLDFTVGGAPVSVAQSPFYKVTTEVFFSGKPVAIKEGAYDYFTADKVGVYTVNYSVTDFAGEKTFLAKREINVTENTGIVFSSIAIQKALIPEAKVLFPMPTATLADGTKADVKITANGTDCTTKYFTVPASGNVEVVYTATIGEKTATKSYTIPVVNNGERFKMNVGTQEDPEYDIPFLTDYLTLPSSYNYAGYSSSNTPFVATNPTKAEKVEFINAIDLNYYRLMFQLDASNQLGSMFEVALTDAGDPNRTLVFGFLQVSEDRMEVYNVLDNGDRVYLTFIETNFTSVAFNFNVKANGDFYNGNIYVGRATTYASGFEFAGFTSKYVYTSFGFTGGTNKVTVSNIAGQAFNLSIKRDLIKPVFYFDKELPDYKETDLGDSYNIVLPYTYDVLNSIKENIATISYFNENSELQYTETIDASKDGMKFVFDKGYGTYLITFKVTDYANRSSELEKRVIVKDQSAPIITINGEIPSVVEVGTILSLPSATATDKVGSVIDINIFYIFDGRVRDLFADNDVYTNPIYFEKAGVYKIFYFAIGQNGNRSLKTVIVEAV